MSTMFVRSGKLKISFSIFRSTQKLPSSAVLICHATGFNKEVYIPLAEEMRKQGYDGDIVLYDQRNHGESGTLNHSVVPKEFSTHECAIDIKCLIDYLYPESIRSNMKIIGVGHSGGGTLSLLFDLLYPGIFHKIIAFEPIVFPLEALENDTKMIDKALKRKNFFKSRQEIYNNFRTREMFREWDERSFRYYVDGGFRPSDPKLGDKHSDGYVLKCSPEQEAATFYGIPRSGLWEKLHLITAPVKIIIGERTGTIPLPVAEHIYENIKKSQLKYMKGVDHFICMQDPSRSATEVLQEITVGSKTLISAHL